VRAEEAKAGIADVASSRPLESTPSQRDSEVDSGNSAAAVMVAFVQGGRRVVESAQVLCRHR
jgi:hypothetical protein